jgi:hypothetical protein
MDAAFKQQGKVWESWVERWYYKILQDIKSNLNKSHGCAIGPSGILVAFLPEKRGFVYLI